jgi:hypothetical protein
MSALTDESPREAFEAVHADIVAAGGDPDKGLEGMSADQLSRNSPPTSFIHGQCTGVKCI